MRIQDLFYIVVCSCLVGWEGIGAFKAGVHPANCIHRTHFACTRLFANSPKMNSKHEHELNSISPAKQESFLARLKTGRLLLSSNPTITKSSSVTSNVATNINKTISKDITKEKAQKTTKKVSMRLEDKLQKAIKLKLASPSMKNLQTKSASKHSNIAPTVVKHPSSEDSKSYFTTTKFQDLSISMETKRALKRDFLYEFMTEVQARSIPEILRGQDCLCRAKTGTGKTLAFLIPAIERMMSNKFAANDIPILILAPTRELALQISEEAEKLLRYHSRQHVYCMYGGKNMQEDMDMLRKGNTAILIATPGRLLDHLQNNDELEKQLRQVRTVIFDEADLLLEMGFRTMIKKMLKYFPPAYRRQTLLFSATFSSAIELIAEQTLKASYQLIDTVATTAGSVTVTRNSVGQPRFGEDNNDISSSSLRSTNNGSRSSSVTAYSMNSSALSLHQHVHQQYLSVPMHQLLPMLFTIIQEHMKSQSTHKILVFFPTARMASYMAKIFQFFKNQFHILEMHSRLKQSIRMKTAALFRQQQNVIMFSSDVSARGMDYPDVSLVLQVGSTEKAQYIHRLGRTARAGKEGQGILLLNEFEESSMLQELRGLPLQCLNSTMVEWLRRQLEGNEKKCQLVVDKVNTDDKLRKVADQCYQAWLGCYNSRLFALKWSKDDLVKHANQYAKVLGLKELPMLERKAVGMLGLKDVDGLRINMLRRRKVRRRY